MASNTKARTRWLHPVLVVASVVAALAAFVGLLWTWWPTPQLGNQPVVFTTVDALYTAVRMHDLNRVSQCAERLRAFSTSGILPSEPAAHLDHIIQRAQEGQWDSATRSLYRFMRAQHRDGKPVVSGSPGRS
jgi:hypothetical protein